MSCILQFSELIEVHWQINGQVYKLTAPKRVEAQLFEIGRRIRADFSSRPPVDAADGNARIRAVAEELCLLRIEQPQTKSYDLLP